MLPLLVQVQGQNIHITTYVLDILGNFKLTPGHLEVAIWLLLKEPENSDNYTPYQQLCIYKSHKDPAGILTFVDLET